MKKKRQEIFFVFNLVFKILFKYIFNFLSTFFPKAKWLVKKFENKSLKDTGREGICEYVCMYVSACMRVYTRVCACVSKIYSTWVLLVYTSSLFSFSAILS